MSNAMETGTRRLGFALPVIIGTAVVVSAGVAVLAGCSGGAASNETTPMTQAEIVAHGAHLVEVSVCDDCHTPWKMGPNGPEPDMTRRLSGHPAGLQMPPPPNLGEGPWGWAGSLTMTAFSGPWGVSYTANLTPSDLGIKNWTDQQFVETIRTGKHWGTGRQIMPPMPWQHYANYSDEDLLAIKTFLMTLPPIDNLVPPYEPPAGMPGGSGGE